MVTVNTDRNSTPDINDTTNWTISSTSWMSSHLINNDSNAYNGPTMPKGNHNFYI